MSADGTKKAMRLFAQASALDPDYAVAYPSLIERSCRRDD
jgi:hypothetical protein